MNEYTLLNDVEKQRFHEALLKRNISAHKINEIVDFYHSYHLEHKTANFIAKPLYGFLLYMVILGLSIYFFLAHRADYFDWVERWHTSGMTYLLHDPLPVSISLIGLLFILLTLPLLYYFLPFQSIKNSLVTSKIFEFCYVAFREAKGQAVRYSYKIETKRIDANFNRLPLMEAFEGYVKKDVWYYKLIAFPIFLLSFCLVISMLSIYWVATKEGITFNSYAGMQKEKRLWADVKEIKTSCFTSRKTFTMGYTVVFNDLKEVNILNSVNANHLDERLKNLAIIDTILTTQKTHKFIPQWNDGRYKFDSTCFTQLKEKYPLTYHNIIPVLGLEYAAKQAHFSY